MGHQARPRPMDAPAGESAGGKGVVEAQDGRHLAGGYRCPPGSPCLTDAQWRGKCTNKVCTPLTAPPPVDPAAADEPPLPAQRGSAATRLDRRWSALQGKTCVG